jgi:uncharacterized protein involved in exopolysaccharide biosynthesis
MPAPENAPVLDYVAVVRQGWRLLLGGVTLGALAALAVNVFATRKYEAWASVLVTDTRSTERGPARNALVPSVRTLLENQTLADRIVREYQLDAPPHDLDAEDFLRSALRVDDVKGTDVIRVRVRLRDPALAARVADRLVALGLELNRRVTRNESNTERDALKAELDTARARMQERETALLEFKQKAQIEVSRKDVDSSLGQRGQMLGVLIDLETEKARLAGAEEQLKGRARVLTVRKSIDNDPALMEAARRAGKEQDAVLGLQMQTEVMSPVYEALEQQVAVSRTRLAALERQMSELTNRLQMGDRNVAQLTSLYQKEIELGKRELELELARRVYSEVLVRYEQAPMTGRKTELQLVDNALVPRRPVFPRPWLNLSLGAAFGLLAGLLAAFVRVYRHLTLPQLAE